MARMGRERFERKLLETLTFIHVSLGGIWKVDRIQVGFVLVAGLECSPLARIGLPEFVGESGCGITST